MPNKMLIDATHPEETRVVVLRGQRVEEFDFESASRRQLRGNIYLAKVTRVEPSLQAAFVDYGGNRHGFLAFSEIHPDYYQIPVADRQALIAEEERAQRAADAEADHRVARGSRRSGLRRDEVRSEAVETDLDSEPQVPSASEAETALDSDRVPSVMAACSEQMAPQAEDAEGSQPEARAPQTEDHSNAAGAPETGGPASEIPIDLARLATSSAAEPMPGDHLEKPSRLEPTAAEQEIAEAVEVADRGNSTEHNDIVSTANITEVNGGEGEEELVESVGGADAMEEVPERMPRLRRQYKIQEVIKRRQVMLVQVVKEERGTKGAALTSYLSLAGRYSVLMPNTARGGGISRKITSAEDRRRLKEIAQELEVPEGMGVILRTAGASRTKTEVKRDFEYLLRMWETVRDLTLKSTAPKLVYEEGSLVKRAIRDLYNKDIDEILVAGDAAYEDAKEFMRMLMPSHAKNVKSYRDGLPIFTRYGIESQLDAMFTPVMQLRSGGYIVLNQAEALVAIDVNSGRATREHHIEDTALKTNLEAAEEIARQLRLRDLAGLIVIDFIDMDEKRNNRAVERRLKECLRHDRARIQVGHISHFGLLEMSRQRIRSSVLESSTEKCPHCGGTGHVRSVASVALQLLRALEEMLLKGATHNLVVRTRSEIALYLLNNKRAHLRALEERFRISIVVNADAGTGAQAFLIDRGEQVHSLEQARALAAEAADTAARDEEEEETLLDDAEGEAAEADAGEAFDSEEGELVDARSRDDDEDQSEDSREPAPEHGQDQTQGRKRRRRKRGRRGSEAREDGAPQHDPLTAASSAEVTAEAITENATDIVETEDAAEALSAESNGNEERRRRRRGRRGGRRNRRERETDADLTESEVLEPNLANSSARQHVALTAAPEPDSPGNVEERPELTSIPEPVVNKTVNEAPAAMPAEAAPSRTSTSEPVRRSTVREPALAGLRHQPAEVMDSSPPAPEVMEPVVSESTETGGADRPRRSGWWSRRVLGRH